MKLLALVSAAALSVGAASCSDDKNDAVNNNPAAANATTPPTTPATNVPLPMADIVGTALKSGVFTQLAGLVVDSGLVDTLRSPGPFTVFAPTDDAFPEALTPVLDALHQPENLKLLQGVLTYHVVPGKLALADLKDGELTTAQGEKLTITHQGDKVLVNGNEIAAGPVEATNGNVYVIKAVLVPPTLLPTVQKILGSAPAGTTPGTTAGTTPGTTTTTG